MSWNYAEANTLAGPSGSFESMLGNTVAGMLATGALFMSHGSAFNADLPTERQIEEVARGPQRAAARARQLVAQAESERIGSFGRLPQEGGEQR